jgi:DNA repair protein RadD
MIGLFDIPNAVRKTARPHQTKAIAMLRQSLVTGKKRVVLQLPTGAGKTYIASQIARGALEKNNRVCFTVPAISLVNQTVEAFEAEGIFGIGVIQSNHWKTNPDAPAQIASVQSLTRRGLPDCSVVIVDECHLRFKVISDWMRREPNKTFIGLSATPWARGMADDWQDLVRPVSMQELIDAGYLSPFRVYAPSHPDLSGVGTVAGDYNEGQLGEVMSERVLIADVVDTWLARAKGLPTLVFAVNLAHAEKIQRAFADKGVQMGYCDAQVDLAEREFLFRQVSNGEIAGIVNVGTLTTGVDADVRCVVMARPTQSEMLFVQCIGRGLRTADGKEHCIILDHSDNHKRLGFVTEISHDHLLGGKEKPESKKADKPEALPRECPSCGAVKQRGPCPACGFEPTRQSEIEFEAGELVEIAPKPKQEKFSFDDKQLFWSMALHQDKARGKGGRLAKAMYKTKFGVWPKGLQDITTQPNDAFLSYERSRRIAYAKGRAKG